MNKSLHTIAIWRVWLVDSLPQWKMKLSLFWSNGSSDEDWMLCDVSLAESFTLRKWRWPPELQGRVQCPVLYEVLNTPTLEGVGGWLADQVGSLPYPSSVYLTFPESFPSYRLPFLYCTLHDTGLLRLSQSPVFLNCTTPSPLYSAHEKSTMF
jgi:hypothetical protein